jgi:tight adherence protein B
VILQIAIIATVSLFVGGLTAFILMKMDISAGRRGRTAYARWLNARYVRKFEEQLTDALGTMSNALRAGFSISQAFESVAESDTHPISDEFALLLQQMRVGMSFDDALESLDKRIGSDDLTLVTTAILISRKTGGNVTEIFDKISETIRGRMKIERKVRTLTAQGRMQGIIVSAMPFFLGAVMTAIKPAMMLPFLGSAAGAVSLVAMVVLIAAGWLIIRRIIRIDV